MANVSLFNLSLLRRPRSRQGRRSCQAVDLEFHLPLQQGWRAINRRYYQHVRANCYHTSPSILRGPRRWRPRRRHICCEERNPTWGHQGQRRNDILVRLLTDFTIYDIDVSCRLVPFSVDFGTNSSKTYSASGIVSAWAESDTISLSVSNDEASENGDSSESAPQRISLFSILEVSGVGVENKISSGSVSPSCVWFDSQFSIYPLHRKIYLRVAELCTAHHTIFPLS